MQEVERAGMAVAAQDRSTAAKGKGLTMIEARLRVCTLMQGSQMEAYY